MFGETTISYVKNWNHPIETTTIKWMFGVPGCIEIHGPNMTKQIKHLALDSVDKTPNVEHLYLAGTLPIVSTIHYTPKQFWIQSHQYQPLCVPNCFNYTIYTQALFNPSTSIFTTMFLQIRYGSPTMCIPWCMVFLQNMTVQLKNHMTLPHGQNTT